jgi:MurNAc alpha-1-phosphate uridylyltransferase
MTAQLLQTAIVLAAGLGTRMRPLTDDRPKPMIDVGGKVLIDWVMDDLAEAGITTAVVNLHYKVEMVSAHLSARRRPTIVVSNETDLLLDTGGGISAALSLVKDDVVLVTNSDALWGGGLAPAVTALTKAWSSETMDSLLLLASMDRAFGFDGAGDFFLGETGTPSRRGTRPQAPMVYAGTQVLHRRLFDGCPGGPFSVNLVWDEAIADARLKAIVHDDDWYHVGTPETVGPTGRALSLGRKPSNPH